MRIYDKSMALKTGKKLKELREQLEYTRAMMAAQLQISGNAYRKNECGETFPGIKSLSQLVQLFDLSMDWFIFDRGPMENVLRQQKEAESRTAEESAAFAPEIKELVENMERIPLLRHEILAVQRERPAPVVRLEATTLCCDPVTVGHRLRQHGRLDVGRCRERTFDRG